MMGKFKGNTPTLQYSSTSVRRPQSRLGIKKPIISDGRNAFWKEQFEWPESGTL